MQVSIPDILQQIRPNQHLTERETAHQHNLSGSHYSDIPNHSYDLSFSVIRQFCKRLHIRIDSLIDPFDEYPKYVLTESSITNSTANSILTYNIEVHYPCALDDSSDKYFVIRYADISTNKQDVENLVCLMNSLRLSIYHIEDVIEDYLSYPSFF